MASTPVEIKQTPTPAPVPTPAPAADSWRSFRGEMDRLFDRFSGAFGMPSLRRMFDWEPAMRTDAALGFAPPSVDVAEDDNTFKITAEVPGLAAGDIEVSLSGDMLVVQGEKKQETERKDKNYYMSERAYGSFQRAFVLPDGVDRDKIAAELANGVLAITLPKTAEARKPARKIAVKSAA
jgi:HSP20 family protein